MGCRDTLFQQLQEDGGEPHRQKRETELKKEIEKQNDSGEEDEARL